MKNTLPLTAAMIALSLLPSAFANTISWNLTGPTSQALGATDTIVSTTGGVTIVLSGFVTNKNDVGGATLPSSWSATTAQASDLYSKASGGDESGIGIAADPSGDHEIFANSFIQINIADVLAQKQINALDLAIGSVQSGEGFSIWGSNTAGKPGTLLMTGTSALDDIAFSIPSYGSYQYISIGATCGNVLLDTVTAVTSSTPEPGTLGLGLAACIALCSVKRVRRFKA